MNIYNAIEANNLRKEFRIYLDRGHNLRDFLSINRRKYYTKRVLDDVSFEIKKGEAIGLIGHNGCGKSTILKLFSQIIYPDKGTIEINGRVSSLIELGAGFHPELTGRENIYINASIFGLTHREIDDRLDDIIEFSELAEAIDNPVRTYSSGMYMRLAFSVAINVDADVLLIDEILAVGDVSFQTKCFSRLKRMKEMGVTIVIVSHSLDQIEKICDRTVWIDAGKIAMSGSPAEVHIKYLNHMERVRRQLLRNRDRDDSLNLGTEYIDCKTEKNDIVQKNSIINITEAWMSYKDTDEENYYYETGKSAVIHIKYHIMNDIKKIIIGFNIYRTDGVYCYGSNTLVDNQSNDLREEGEVSVILDSLNLLNGHYSVDIVFNSEDGDIIAFCRGVLEFDMLSNSIDFGVCRLEHRWLIK